MTMINVGRQSLASWLPNYLVTTVGLGGRVFSGRYALPHAPASERLLSPTHQGQAVVVVAILSRWRGAGIRPTSMLVTGYPSGPAGWQRWRRRDKVDTGIDQTHSVCRSEPPPDLPGYPRLSDLPSGHTNIATKECGFAGPSARWRRKNDGHSQIHLFELSNIFVVM